MCAETKFKEAAKEYAQSLINKGCKKVFGKIKRDASEVAVKVALKESGGKLGVAADVIGVTPKTLNEYRD